MPRRSSVRRMLFWSFAAFGVALALPPGAAVADDDAHAERPSIDTLIAQIEGRSCLYSSLPSEVCKPSRSPESWLVSLLSRTRRKYSCPLGAARCLEELGPAAAEAVPALCTALLEGPNDYDTGDGYIAVRSAIAAALGAIGDPRAIDPLARALAEGRPPDGSWTAQPSAEPAARREILRALGAFGPLAARHWAPIAAVLAERNADTGFFETQRQAFEESEAMRLATEEIRAKHPEGASFVVPWETVRAARARIDRAAPAYVTGLESRAQDGIARVAAEALGKLGVKTAIPLLRTTLANRSAAEAAARALGELGASDPATLDRLEDLVASGEYGPGARASAARALGALGSARSVGPLTKALDESPLRQAAAEALGAIGPDAARALPVLRSILDERSLAERTARSVNYPVEASRQLYDKIAAARAIGRIAGPQAPRILKAYGADPDIGHVVRRILRERDGS